MRGLVEGGLERLAVPGAGVRRPRDGVVLGALGLECLLAQHRCGELADLERPAPIGRQFQRLNVDDAAARQRDPHLDGRYRFTSTGPSTTRVSADGAVVDVVAEGI